MTGAAEHQRRLPLLQLGRISSTRPGFGENTPIANGSGSDSLLDPRHEDAAVDAAARAVPARVLHPRPRRTNRRSERRLEGPRAVGELRHQLPVAHRGRQGNDEQDGEVPGAARSARAVSRGREGSKGRRGAEV